MFLNSLLLVYSMFSFIARQWIAGETIDDAVQRAKKENKRGFRVMLNYLGEDYHQKRQVESTIIEYETLLSRIAKEKLQADLSIKPSQLGLWIDKQYCMRNFDHLLSLAKRTGAFVWFDMESTHDTQDTIDLYLTLRKKYRIGICIQSTLKRSERDLEHIMENNGIVRLVKGAYKETAKVAYQDIKDINRNYIHLMDLLFENADEFAIATHDEQLIKKAIEKQSKKKFQLQFLLGIRGDLKKKYKRNYTISEYMPYGKEWLTYILRRLLERKRNIELIARSLFTG